MSVTPTGAPAWSRTADAEIYGGHADKRDYQTQGVVNPKTDVSAAQFARLCADVAACARVASFCQLTLTCDDATPDDPTVNFVRQMDLGQNTAGYAGDSPPSGFPTCTRVSDGKVQVVLASTPADDFSVSQALTTYHAQADVLGSSVFATVHIVKVNATTWTFEAVDSSGTAIADAQMAIEVG
jgi:hypothetical protein